MSLKNLRIINTAFVFLILISFTFLLIFKIENTIVNSLLGLLFF